MTKQVLPPLKLTPRQQQILNLVQSVIERTGAPPTRVEIASELGFRSPNSAEEHLRALARKGVIEMVRGTSRGIRLKPDVLRKLHASRKPQCALPLPGLEPLALPLVGRVAAGSPILALENIDQTYYVESHLFSRRPDYLLRIRGMSMRNIGIIDGDLLAVQKTHDAKNGQIIVARLGDDVTVKRFRHHCSMIELSSENPDFEPIMVTPDMPFEIEGLAVGLVRNHMPI
ncbi:MAG: transcriptional repressor LexA [Burkholderiales bacterium]